MLRNFEATRTNLDVRRCADSAICPELHTVAQPHVVLLRNFYVSGRVREYGRVAFTCRAHSRIVLKRVLRRGLSRDMTARSSACALHLVRVAVPDRIKVAFVAPSLRILGGQAVQADRLLAAWKDDPDVDAWLVPVNPMPPALLRFALDVK